MMTEQRELRLPDEAATRHCAQRLAGLLQPGLLLTLSGDLGSGKTTFVRAVLRALGHKGAVKSPTYTLVEPYHMASLDINHFDLYRLGDAEELELMGFRDYLGPGSVCFVEWPERAAGYLPPADLCIELSAVAGSASARMLVGRACSAAGEKLLEQWLA